MADWLVDRRQAAMKRDFGRVVDPNDNKTNPKTMDKLHVKYSTDNKGQGCFTIFARGLKIDNSDRSNYWRWQTDEDGTETAEMVTGTWLGVKGSIKTVELNLTYGVTYKVSFLLKMTQESTMKGKQVNLKLSLPGINKEDQKPLPTSPNQQCELEVGLFKMTAQNTGDMNFAMEQSFEESVKGLIIKGVEIRPV